MAFIREVISAEDRKKYGLDETCSDVLKRGVKHWVIDRNREIFLIKGPHDKEGYFGFWLYYNGRIIGISGDENCRDGKNLDPFEIYYEVWLNDEFILKLLTEAVQASVSQKGFKNTVTIKPAPKFLKFGKS
jgi:hypothetical protein